jgi:hypothetical protein
MMFAALLLAALSPAMADEATAESCLKTKIWEGYNSGWAVRTATNATLGQGEHRIYLVTLYAGTEYKIMVCGDNLLTNADIVLYDSLGNELLKDTQDDREPVLTYKASATDTFYIAVHATRTVDPAAKAGVATAVTYK